MIPSTLKVLTMLENNKATGVTWDLFPKGTAIRSRISDLRQSGYRIVTKMEELAGGTRRARYFYLGRKA